MGTGQSEFEHDADKVNKLLVGLDLAAKELIAETPPESELPSTFMASVLNAETEIDEMILGLTEYEELFKNDISRIRTASEEIVSHEKQVAYKISVLLESVPSTKKSL
ncbi:hypothetical protein QJV14_10380 [Listeria cossartiae subsp. cayugensis]|uniref:LXG domain-containing protein n=1 Tax=Listeria cossartiae subsp. cayugensis TaxID=2713505 RepID=A0ABU2IPL6_9LIST|nr:hypothetical protein [Listeria cossartiae]MCD2247846.1 hypothetical protein [Listeria marthii]MDT0004146.1 hypothetical protein [Listeria cossartiae subsp. cayugensis]MDT0020540.1 hypothetical protein [Listeria cossartiae subsp. cayugensis]MDT0036245.1 hypothetical protein [Listeria cossartiae subsp. cayugensis]MDT0042291.1 hypothetical protein [Listeria cossartiae subsp. cayugensis]